jgi:hypothetical protein
VGSSTVNILLFATSDLRAVGLTLCVRYACIVATSSFIPIVASNMSKLMAAEASTGLELSGV